MKSGRGTAPARLLTPLTWGAAAVGLLGLLVVRPLAGLVVLAGSGLRFDERAAISFFGIRGVGSFYYLAYGYNTEAFGELDLVFALVGFVVSEFRSDSASRHHGSPHHRLAGPQMARGLTERQLGPCRRRWPGPATERGEAGLGLPSCA